MSVLHFEVTQTNKYKNLFLPTVGNSLKLFSTSTLVFHWNFFPLIDDKSLNLWRYHVSTLEFKEHKSFSIFRSKEGLILKFDQLVKYYI